MGNTLPITILLKLNKMEKLTRYLFIFIFIVLGFKSSGQIASERWFACLGGSEWDEGSGMIRVDNTYWIVSRTKSNNGDISFNHGAWDIWLVHTDSIGNLLSEKTFGGSYADGGFTDIKGMNDSTFYIIGDSKSVDGDVSNNPWPGPNGNLWVLQINNQGEIVWERMLGGSGTDWIRDANVTADGGVIVLGLSTSGDGDITDPHGAWDLWMVKLDQAGEKQWNLSLGGAGSEEGGSVKQTSDNGYIISGCTDGYGGGNYDTTNNYHGVGGYEDAWIIKLDSMQTIQWQQCYGGHYHDCATNILELQDGYVVLGTTMSNDGDVSGFHGVPGNGASGNDIWVFKIDFSGNLIWQRCLGGSSDEYARNIFTTSDGGFMIVGATGSPDGDVEGYQGISSGIYEDVWFAKLTAGGELTWQYCYGGGGREYMYRGAVQKSDYNYVVAFGTDTDTWQCVAPMWPDLRIAEIGDSTTGINQASVLKGIKVYPNPAKNYVVFENKAWQTSLQHTDYIHITNIYGQEVERFEIKGDKMIWNISQIKPGIYFYKTDGGAYMGKIMISR